MFAGTIQLLGLSNDDVKTIGAGATTVGVLLALFGPSLRHWWRRPLLSLEYEGNVAEPFWDHVCFDDQAFFLRARVQNARGCDAAEDAQVLIASYRAAPLGLEGRALEWSGLRPWDGTPITAIRLPAGLQRHIDLVQVTRLPGVQGPPTSTGSLQARLCVYPKPGGAAHLVPTGNHDVVVAITAANADAITYRFTIVYNGYLSARLLAPPRWARRRSLGAISRTTAKRLLGDLRT